MEPSSKLQPSTQVAAAAWLAPRLAPFGSCLVASVVPGGFPAYVRIAHPAGSVPGNMPSELLRVAVTALAEHTHTPHCCWFCVWEGHGWLHPGGTIGFYPVGSSEAPASDPVARADELRLPATLRAALSNPARFRLPSRDYLLLEGPLEAVAEIGWNFPGGGGFVPQSPNLLWPDDHAWCVASEIDLVYTLLGGTVTLAERLMGDPRLDARRVSLDDQLD